MKTTLQRRGTSGHSLLRSVLLFCATVWLGLAASQAGQAGIDDHAAFFSETARSQASRTIAEIKRQFHEDLFIETFNTLPDSVKQGVNLQDKAALNKAIEKWTVEDAKKRAVTGVYVLIVKDPPHLQAVVGNQTARQAFTVQDRDSLARIMLNKLHAKQNDEALADGANFVFSTMKSHLPNRPAASNNSGYRTSQTNQGSGHGFLWLIVGVIGLWLVVSIFRSLFGAGRGMAQGPMAGGMPPPMPGGYPPGSYPPASSGGGGFMRSMLGGMFGSAAGMWMYDRFFGGHSSSGWGDGGGSNYGGGGGGFSGGGDSGYSNQDTDYSGSGGSFGDDYGSNSGGGGGGGGDWGGGGGDSGGGGGDSGGGGGDF